MTIYYVDPGAGGNVSPYASWANAATNMQSALDLATTGGDVVYCRGTQTLTTAMLVKASGSLASRIMIIGCDASGVARAGQFTLDGNAASTYCLDLQSYDYLDLVNITCTDATSHGIKSDGSEALLYESVICHGNGGYGVFGNYLHRYIQAIKCKFYNNSGRGFLFGYDLDMWGCAVYGNGSHGIEGYFNYSTSINDSLFYENGGAGLYFRSGPRTGIIRGNVIADNTSHGIDTQAPQLRFGIIGNRITGNGGYGIVVTSATDAIFEDYNVFEGNSSGARSNIDAGLNSDDAPADDGFVNSATDDYNLKSGAELRNTELPITGQVSLWFSPGINPEEPTGGGGLSIVNTRRNSMIGR